MSEENKPDLEQAKEVAVVSAPRNAGKIKIKKALSFEEMQAKRLLESVKTWSKKMLERQLASERCTHEIKEACKNEIKKRYAGE